MSQASIRRAKTKRIVKRGAKKASRATAKSAGTAGKAAKKGAKKAGGFVKAKAHSYAEKKREEARERKHTKQLIRVKEKFNCDQNAADLVAGSGKTPRWWYARGFLKKGKDGRWQATKKGEDALERRNGGEEKKKKSSGKKITIKIE